VATRHLRIVDTHSAKNLEQLIAGALGAKGPAVFLSSSSSPRDVPSTVNSDVALVVETSGSTQMPKRVWHTADSLMAAARQSNTELGGRGVWWQALPSNYIAGAMVMIRALASGGSVLPRNRNQK
jgi:Acyl-CoA synthetases (AMP-forming)/AMP-acid ligases II